MPEQVTVDKAELLTVLRENRSRHRDAFRKAQEGYRRIAIRELDRSLDDARAGHEIRLLIQLPVPEDHTGDYDREIRMLEMHRGDTVDIDSRLFDQVVMDRWRWSDSFRTTNASYGVKS